MTDYHPVVQKIRDYLDDQRISYQTFEHAAVRTSEEAAAIRPEYSLAQGAKALIVRIRKRVAGAESSREFVQVVVPGDAKFDAKKVKTILDAKDLRFATTDEVRELTDGVESGGVPPFGNLFGIRVVVDPSLYEHENIIFNAGDRRFSVAMLSVDHKRVVQPIVAVVV